MTVSIIIPTWNRAELLPECIESALNQTYKDTEIVIVDDGSKDNTLEVLSKYKRLNIIKTEHVNTAHAMNCGINGSKGNWIKFLGSDDILLPDCIENFMNRVTNPDPIYYSDYYLLKGIELIEYIAPEYPRQQQFEQLFKAFYGGSSFINRFIFYKHGMFDETFDYAEDYDFWLRCSSRGVELRHLPFFACKFRLHAGQNTNNYGKSLDDRARSRYAKIPQL